MMGLNNEIARWGNYKWARWEITRTNLGTFSSASMSREWVEKQKKKKAHQGPVEFKFKFPLYKELNGGLDIAARIQSWNKKVGKVAAFYIGTMSVGLAKKYRLTGVDVTNIEQVGGVIVHCDIELTFQSTKKGVKNKRKSKKTSKKSSKSKKKKK